MIKVEILNCFFYVELELVYRYFGKIDLFFKICFFEIFYKI